MTIYALGTLQMAHPDRSSSSTLSASWRRAVFILTLGAVTCGLSVGAFGFKRILNIVERPDPWIVNGCEIKPKTVCPGVDLRHADLKKANLNGADLRGAKMARASLRHASLKGANLSGANLDGADLMIAFLQGANFQGASLRGAVLAYSRPVGANFTDADLTAADMEMVRANKINFARATLRNANLQEAKLYNSNLALADLQGAKLKYTIFQDAVMDGCEGCPHNWQTNEKIWNFEKRAKEKRPGN